jgi:hypothetical protein
MKLIDSAYVRDKSGNVHTGQALLLALLLHTKGKHTHNNRDLAEVTRMMQNGYRSGSHRRRP